MKTPKNKNYYGHVKENIQRRHREKTIFWKMFEDYSTKDFMSDSFITNALMSKPVKRT